MTAVFGANRVGGITMATEPGAGLAGIVAGHTAIATVGKEGKGLTYRGYSIHDLAEQSTFEEVAYLLIYGRLPKQADLDEYKAKLRSLRGLPAPLKTVLELIPRSTHPMDVMRTGCSMLGTLEPEGAGHDQVAVANRLTACFSAMLLYWHHFHAGGHRIDTETDDDSTAGHFLHLLHGKKPDELHRRAIDVSLILYAEHEFNASTFTARTIVSTLPDFYSAVTGGIGALRGPLHGGANEAAMELIEQFANADEAEKALMDMLDAKKLIMGFGHRVYKVSDPRSDIIKAWSRNLSKAQDDNAFFRSPSASSKSCVVKKRCSRIWISTAPPPIIFAASRRRCLRRSSSSPASPAGRRTSSSSAPTIA